MFRLPVSGLEVRLRHPSGAEDVSLLEAREYDMRLQLALLSSLAQPAGVAEVEWATLTVTDLDALLLHLRQLVFGDLIQADMNCPSAGCGARVDVVFRIGDYLKHHEPHNARGVEKANEDGWFRLRQTSVEFRLPTGADQIAVTGHAQAERELIRRCVRPSKTPARLLKRVETAMGALAPSLSDFVRGTCAECGATVDIFFDPQHFILRELRDQARFVYVDVHLIAERYHWTEADILALPRERRINYAETIRRELSLD